MKHFFYQFVLQKQVFRPQIAVRSPFTRWISKHLVYKTADFEKWCPVKSIAEIIDGSGEQQFILPVYVMVCLRKMYSSKTNIALNNAVHTSYYFIFLYAMFCCFRCIVYRRSFLRGPLPLGVLCLACTVSCIEFTGLGKSCPVQIFDLRLDTQQAYW